MSPFSFCKISFLASPAKAKNANPPYFIGSLIRGAFGYGLKDVVCSEDSGRCETCQHTKDCLYYDFYESKNAPYRLGFNLGSEIYDFDLFIFSDFESRAPLILAGMHKALSEIGLFINGKKITFSDFSAFINDKLVYENGNLNLPSEFELVFRKPDSAPKNLILHLKSPLRIKKNNAFIFDSSALEMSDILSSIYHKYCDVKGIQKAKLPFIPRIEILDSNLEFIELVRKSNRQQSYMNFGGIIGKMQLKSVDENSYNLLKAGEILGVGKQTSFGLGNIEIGEI